MDWFTIPETVIGVYKSEKRIPLIPFNELPTRVKTELDWVEDDDMLFFKYKNEWYPFNDVHRLDQDHFLHTDHDIHGVLMDTYGIVCGITLVEEFGYFDGEIVAQTFKHKK